MLILIVTTPAPLWAETISFQNGVFPNSSYMGAEDTRIQSNATTTNYGTNNQIRMNGDPDDLSGLLKWDVSAIPSNATITEVTITVSVRNPTTQSYEIYELKKPWVEAEATWNIYATGKTWDIPGASGALDHGSEVLGTMTSGPTQSFVTYPLNMSGVAVVQNWVKDPATNLGVIIQNYTNTDSLFFYSRDSGTLANRPKLTVTYTILSVTGSVYSDTNHNRAMDGAESGIAGVTVDLYDSTNTLMDTTITAADGTYTFQAVNDGDYEIRETHPAGYVSTTPDMLAMTVSGVSLTNQNFGDFAGAKISGVVFADTGAGGGTPHNGIQDGAEGGIIGVSVRVTDPANTTTYDQTATGFGGAYTLWVPTSVRMAVGVHEMNPSNYISITSDILLQTIAPGDDLLDNNFADVPPLLFAPNGHQNILPGGTVTYPHRITAGTVGQITLTATSTQKLVWTFYNDLNENSALDAGEPPLAPADLDLIANQTLQIVVRAHIPSNLPLSTLDTTTLTATQAFANSTSTDIRTVINQTMVAMGNLQLTKTGSVTTALPGDTVDYTLTYRNVGMEELTAIVIYDALSEFVVFDSSVPPPDPGFPSPVGALQWMIPGTLAGGGYGEVFYTVRVK